MHTYAYIIIILAWCSNYYYLFLFLLRTWNLLNWTVLPMFYAYICIHNNNSRLMLELLLPVFVSSKNLEPIKLNSFTNVLCIHNNNSRLMLELLLPVFVSSKNLEPIKLNSFTNVWWWLYWSYNIHRWISMRWWSYNKDTINIDEYWWDEEHTTYTDEYRISMRMGHTTSVLPMFH